MNPAIVALAGLDLPLPLAVAYSGGADSTVLLLAAAQRWPGQVKAIHVHHGLQAAADDFELHCVQACAALGVPLRVIRVDAKHASGESPEDAARRARYTALAGAALEQGAKAVLLGQHADDQVETLLIALSRGAGLPGLAGMAPVFERHGVPFVRPLLAIGADKIRAWVAAQGVRVVHDPTNADTGLTRNRIRHLVLPALERALPQFRDTFSRSARHAAQAQSLLTILAAQDLQAMGGVPLIEPLRAWPRERQGNVLRHWLRTGHGESASAAQLDELLDQVAACATRGHKLHLKVARGYVDREDTRLIYTPT
nr:tRNA lysidine(34) synthetase TilS [Caenimonas sedimenti]